MGDADKNIVEKKKEYVFIIKRYKLRMGENILSLEEDPIFLEPQETVHGLYAYFMEDTKKTGKSDFIIKVIGDGDTINIEDGGEIPAFEKYELFRYVGSAKSNDGTEVKHVFFRKKPLPPKEPKKEADANDKKNQDGDEIQAGTST